MSGGRPRRRAYRALDLTFAVSTTDDELGGYVGRIFRQFAVDEDPAHLFSLLDRTDGDHTHRLLYFDDRLVATTSHPSDAVRELVRSVNREAMALTPDCLYLHASAAEHDGRAAIFPAAMESGKSTLVAGLARRGLRYVTDEAVAIDLDTLAIRPYPKPVSLDPGSWDVLRGLRPAADDRYLATQWQVEPASFGDDAIASACRPAAVFFPRYDPAARTELVPLSPAQAVMAMAENALNLRLQGPRALGVLAAVARTCPAWRLPLSDLDEACGLVEGVLADLGVAAAAGSGR